MFCERGNRNQINVYVLQNVMFPNFIFQLFWIHVELSEKICKFWTILNPTKYCSDFFVWIVNNKTHEVYVVLYDIFKLCKKNLGKNEVVYFYEILWLKYFYFFNLESIWKFL